MNRVFAAAILALALALHAAPASAQADNAEITFWQSVQDSKEPAELEAYLQSYPKGKFAPLAKLRLKKLKRSSPDAATAGKKNQPRAKHANAKIYAALKNFGDVLERVRADYVEKPDDKKIINAAIEGVLKKFPNDAARSIFERDRSKQCSVKGSAGIYKCLDLFGDVLEALHKEHKGKDNEMVEAAIIGMLGALDPHSAYLSPQFLKDAQVQFRGAFGGIGTEVTMENGLVKVVAPLDDSPAQRAGILSGDLMTHLDGAAVQGLTLQQAVKKMRGKTNTPIKITIKREGVQKPIIVKIIRARIQIKPVKWRAEGDVGYIRITTFNENTGKDFKKAVKALESQIGAALKGYVLDIRNTPGGLLDQVIAVTDDFLEKGVIAVARGRKPGETQTHNARAGQIMGNKKIVVLINGGTSSGSEILASALQDNKRARLIGTRTFGKGSVQTIIPLGSQGALRLTTAHYFTPSGTSIQAKGIDPDIVLEQDIPKGMKAKQTRAESSLKGHFRAADGVERKGSSAYVPKDKAKDKQLQAALRIVRGENIKARATASGSAGSDSAEVSLWKKVWDAGDPAGLEAYLKAYPAGKFASLARLRIKKLKSGAAVNKQRRSGGESGTGLDKGKSTGAGDLGDLEGLSKLD